MATWPTMSLGTEHAIEACSAPKYYRPIVNGTKPYSYNVKALFAALLVYEQ